MHKTADAISGGMSALQEASLLIHTQTADHKASMNTVCECFSSDGRLDQKN